MSLGLQTPPRVVLVTSLGVGLAAASLDQIRAIPEAPWPWLLPTDVLPAFAAAAVVAAAATPCVWLVMRLLGRLIRAQAGVASAPRGRWRGIAVRFLLALPLVLTLGAAWSWTSYQEVLTIDISATQTAAAAAIALILLGVSVRAALRWNAWLIVALFATTILAGAVALGRPSRFVERAPEALIASGHKPAQIVLITTDTLRADALSWYNPETAATPNMDALAEDAVVFRNAVSTSSWTVPSMASLLTGLPAMAHLVGTGGGPLPAEIPSLAEYLRDAGYLTAAVVDNPLLEPELNLFRGFREYAQMTEYWPPAESAGRSLLRRLLQAGYRATGTEAVTATTTGWMRQNRDRDFLLWVHYYDPHVPYEPPAKLQPPGAAPEKIGTTFSRQNDVRQGMKLTAEEREWVRKLYLAETQYVDEQIGAVMATLRDLGLYDESLIILTSDHGEEFWEHGGYEHGHSIYQEVVHVPLMIKLPSSAVKGPVEAPVSNRYLMPTILEQAGIQPQDACALHRSLSELWRGEAESFGPIALVSNLYYEQMRGVWFDGAKYIRSEITGREELFDLVTDPGETQSLIGIDDDLAARGRLQLAEYEQLHRAVYDCYGAVAQEIPEPHPAVLERLKSLGYVQ